MSSGAEVLLGAAVDAGVEVVFANPGTTEMWLVGALDSLAGRLRPVLCLAETVATGAADGYARLARKPAATILHLGLAATVSRYVARPLTLPAAISDLGSAMRMMSRPASPDSNHEEARAPVGGKIATFILPHDVSWEAAASRAAAAAPPAAPNGSSLTGAQMGALRDFIRQCAEAMGRAGRGKVALYLGGEALLAPELTLAGKVAAATGAVLMCENAFARVDRGAGLPVLRRLPYFPQEAAAALAPFKMVVTVGTRRPVAMFGYKGGPSQLIAQPDDDVWELDALSARQALEVLAMETGAARVEPLVNCGGVFAPPRRPPIPPPGKLTAGSLCQAVAALQPEGCVLGCPSFSHLTLTGGAIGSGIPMAVGAAIACPGKKVINLQADGSAMYSVQGLWTQAREKLDVVTVICANNAYAILKIEMAKQGIATSRQQSGGLMDLGRPPVDWISLARGVGVPAAAAATAEELVAQLRAALAESGPFLIEARLA
eukprot:jgi/Tetstr1/466670/TSEL_011158.t1